MFLGPEGRKQLRAVGAVSSIGIELVLAICIGYFGGHWLDQKLGTTWLEWVGLGFGLVAGFRSLYRLARKPPQFPTDPTNPP
jgi:ATP synthase protein I